MNFLLSWKEKENAHDRAYQELDFFFESLYEQSLKETSEIVVAYREPQQRFASTIMDAIKNKKVLLIQAGVGTGKSFGYLIPIFYTWNNVQSFQRIIISTSSLALQEQLIGDVEFVSKLLGITIKCAAVKGINNYACIKKIKQKIASATAHDDHETYATLTKMEKEMYKAGTADKSKLSKVDRELWKSISVCGGCDRCEYFAKCMFQEAQYRSKTASIVITNHTHLNNMISELSGSFMGTDMLVIDEAHNLEEQIRLVNQAEINFDEFIKKLDSLYYILESDTSFDYSYELKKLSFVIEKLKYELITFAIVLRSNARYLFNRQGNADKMPIQECDKLSINPENVKIKERIVILCGYCKSLEEILKNLPERNNIANIKSHLSGIIKIFMDLSLGKDSKLLYWVKFVDKNKIKLIHTIKDIKPYLDKMMGKEIPIVLTSATMMTNGNYNHLASSLGLNEGTYDIENPISSPFNYEENSLFYYDDKMVSPTDKDRAKYIEELAFKIADLIVLTQEKALVLFTSKVDMKEVYAIVKTLLDDYDIYLQEEGDVTRCKEQFLSSDNSCLFATGAFWEGMDFPGKTLSNLIIAKLPFPVQDPIVDYKRAQIPKSESFQIDLSEMLMKLAQGTGRLIRSVDDTGIVCCLDSRTPKYLESIQRSLPFKTFTNDLEVVQKFAEEKIIDGIGGNDGEASKSIGGNPQN